MYSKAHYVKNGLLVHTLNKQGAAYYKTLNYKLAAVY